MSDAPLAKVRALRERVAAVSAGKPAAAASDPAMSAYLDKVAHHAYKITDEEVHALLVAGRTQDEIFEATVLAAMDAAIAHWEAGLAALDQATRAVV